MVEGRVFELADEAATAAMGAAIARLLGPGEAVCLSGPLGAGKSSLARALIRTETTPEEEVPSPTFTLVQSYEGRRFPIAHFDLYRLGGGGEVEELGLWEALEVGVALVEWPERLGAALPADRLDVEIAYAEPGRVATLVGWGAWADRVAGLVAGRQKD